MVDLSSVSKCALESVVVVLSPLATLCEEIQASAVLLLNNF